MSTLQHPSGQQVTQEDRALREGDVVNFGGGSIPWEVTWIGQNTVRGRSLRSGTTRLNTLAHTYWADTREAVRKTIHDLKLMEVVAEEVDDYVDDLTLMFQKVTATEQMLDTLGIHLARRPQRCYAAKISAERGRGAIHWFIDLADDLSIEEQVEYLELAWRYLSPVCWPAWFTREWERTRKRDSLLETRRFVWWRKGHGHDCCTA